MRSFFPKVPCVIGLKLGSGAIRQMGLGARNNCGTELGRLGQ
jgi:hypothetical protein